MKNPKADEFKCPICGQKFESKEEMLKHGRKHAT